ncbi:hypothetical protein PHMEG_00034577 [Phytophthora megakarya]|uniref:PiggyBac transposable element-derived protein domain-containing protein n=1 Tax=Phytophthora megakarya TaxID=4795 RepID=A0A225UR30_9STRA|nr:hypothetical protein PHMEG_00034577 [Phytophthora megakarya]
MAFDDAMLLQFNRMRVYMKNKHHNFEVYCGKKQMQDNTTPPDEKSGPTAVVRNLKKVFSALGPSDFRLVVTDRFYTSMMLAMQLLIMKFYGIGTIMMKKRGLYEAILPHKKNGKRTSNKRPKTIEKGTYQVAESLHVPVMKAVRWYDNCDGVIGRSNQPSNHKANYLRSFEKKCITTSDWSITFAAVE